MATPTDDPPTPPQPGLFGEPAPVAPPPKPKATGVRAIEADAELRALGAAMPPLLRMGSSSWYFPGWRGLVWADEVSEAALPRQGLPAYAQHPLLRTVSLDRSFYRPLPSAEYARLAAQVPADFRFVVKAASMVCDATVREAGSGRALLPNPLFLDPAAALEQVWRPAVEGLGDKLGALVFQLSPLPRAWLAEPALFLARLDAMFEALFAWRAAARTGDSGLVAIELRDPGPLGPELAALLARHGVRYCVGLHDRMPPLEEQLPMLRALWPGPLVLRWNLQRGYRYGAAKEAFEPFDKLLAPDPQTRSALARLVAATLRAGQPALVTINNKAEGSAPLSVRALAREIAALLSAG
ncbi:DUF72 domain-containing protein [Rivibacter subsaxonicus]|nr:DUF72 domain-containing protein [Rivibacter subsaxonicus]